MNAREKHPLGFCVVTGWLRQVQADDFFVIIKCVCGVEHLLRAHFPLAPCSTSPSLVPDLRFEANDWQVSMQRYCIHHCQSCPHAAKTPFPYPPPPAPPHSMVGSPCTLLTLQSPESNRGCGGRHNRSSHSYSHSHSHSLTHSRQLIGLKVLWPGKPPPPSLCPANALSNEHFRLDGVF